MFPAHTNGKLLAVAAMQPRNWKRADVDLIVRSTGALVTLSLVTHGTHCTWLRFSLRWIRWFAMMRASLLRELS